MMKPSTVRMCGIAVALGAITWSIGWLQAGVRPTGADGQPINDRVEIWTSGIYLLGLLALLLTMRVTCATGMGRLGRWALNVEIMAVILAIGWTIPFAFDANREHNLVLTVLDAFWPLSMLGKIVIGMLIIHARRWPTPARYLPFAASMLFPIYIATGVLGLSEWTQTVVRAIYFAVAHVLLGLAVIRQVAPLAEDTSPTREGYLEPERA
jgi:hypothetical protein